MIGKTRSKGRLRFESLERKLMLAGIVGVQVIEGDLIIQGDELDNAIEISVSGDAGAETYEITGDGIASIPVAEVTGRVKILMGEGNDTVTMGTADVPVAVPGDLQIIMSAGDDTVELTNVTVGDDLMIVTSAGDDKVTLSGVTVEDDAMIHTSSGDDTVTIDGSLIKDDLSVHTGSGKDTLEVTDTTVGDDATLNTSGGVDAVTITDVVVADRFTLFAGSGQEETVDGEITGDTVTIERLYAGTPEAIPAEGETPRKSRRLFGRQGATINAGSGMDTVTLTESIFHEGLRLDLGQGDDSLTASANTVAIRTFINGGSGTDTANDGDGIEDGKDDNSFANSTVIGFENPAPADPEPTGRRGFRHMFAQLWEQMRARRNGRRMR